MNLIKVIVKGLLILKNIQISLSIVLGAILGPLFFFISPEWSILYGGFIAGTVAFFALSLDALGITFFK